MCIWNAAGVVAFQGNKIAIVYIDKVKAWDIIFGHLEAGETPEEAVRREAYEEGGIILKENLKVVYAFQDKSGFNLVFEGDIDSIEALPSGHETSAMRLLPIAQAIELSANYMPVNRTLILAALESRE